MYVALKHFSFLRTQFRVGKCEQKTTLASSAVLANALVKSTSQESNKKE